MKSSKFSFLFIALFFVTLLHAGNYNFTIEWQKSYGGSDAEGGYHNLAQRTKDGGFIVGGWSASGISGDKSEVQRGDADYWVIKTDSLGNKQWDKSVGSLDGDVLSVIRQATDGGYFLGGETSAGISGDKTSANFSRVMGVKDVWIVKLNSAHTIQWQKDIGGSEEEDLYDMWPTYDGGVILAIASDSDSSGNKTTHSHGIDDYWIVKLDSTGAIQWEKDYGGGASDAIEAIRQTSDSGFIVLGESNSDSSGDKITHKIGNYDLWILKLNKNGNIEWQKTIGGDKFEFADNIQQTKDGGYIIAGISKSGISGNKTEPNIGVEDGWLVKLDSFGNIQWQHTVGTDNLDAWTDVQLTNDNGYIVGGYSWSVTLSSDSLSRPDYWLLKFDNLGNIKWQKTFGGNSVDEVTSFFQVSDSEYIVKGISGSGISGDKTVASHGDEDFWMFKLKVTGGDSLVTIVKEQNREEIKISPNPFRESTNFYFEENSKAKRLQLLDVNGKEIENINIANQSSYELQRNQLSKGLYFYVITDNKGMIVNRGKIIGQ
ncbi:MAG: type sorting protein [Bacteroidota bacterium]|nr:type sorting protein [Bacteroidota bacterium]